MSIDELEVLFPMGITLVTPGVQSKLSPIDIFAGLIRHMHGDWGNLDEHDWKANEDAVEFGGRIFSQYTDHDGSNYWIITECDRSVTTVLLPEEY